MKIPKESFSGYGMVLKQSWQTMWRSPIAFMPVLYSYIGFMVITALFFLIASLAYGGVEGFINAGAASLIAFGALFVIVMFFFGVHVLSVNISVMRRLSAGKRVSLRESFKHASGLYRRSIGAALSMLVASLPLFIFIGLIVLVGTLSQGSAGLVVLTVILGIVAFVAALAYGAWFMFIVPMIGYTNLNGWQMIGQAWKLLFKDAGHVILTYLINFGISIGIGMVLGIVSMILFGISDPAVWWQFVQFVVNLVASIWLLLFVFGAYFARYKPKVK